MGVFSEQLLCLNLLISIPLIHFCKAFYWKLATYKQPKHYYSLCSDNLDYFIYSSSISFLSFDSLYKKILFTLVKL